MQLSQRTLTYIYLCILIPHLLFCIPSKAVLIRTPNAPSMPINVKVSIKDYEHTNTATSQNSTKTSDTDSESTNSVSSMLFYNDESNLYNNRLLNPPENPNLPINTKSKYIQLTNNLPVYILPAYYSFSSPYSMRDIPMEIKFQVSFRVVYFEHLVCKHCSFDFAYTQTHWFQIYNTQDSRPMRDINFSPSLNFNYERQLPFLGGYITWLRIGLWHLSNGERKDNLDVGLADRRNEGLTPDDSRWFSRSKSIDRIVAQIDWQRGRFGLSLRAWVPLSRYLLSDLGDNDNITSYIGFGDIFFSYEYKRHLFELYVNNIFNNYFTKSYWDWKGRLEFGYTYRLSKRVGLYTQVLYGFGDSLYEFNYHITRLGMGLRLNF